MKNLLYIIRSMSRKLLVSLVIAGSLFLLAPALASAQEQTCTQVYGGGVVCGAATPEHKPVPTGIGDNLALMGGGFILASGVLLFLSKKAKKSLTSL